MSRRAADRLDRVVDTAERAVDGRVDRTTAAVVGLAALALLLRLVDLGGRPFHWGEGRVGYWTLRYLETGAFEYRPVAGGPLLYIVDRWVFALLGASDASARLVVALVGGLLPLAALLYRHRLRDDETVVLAVVLAVSPTLVYYSRALRGDVPLAAFAFVAVGAVLYALDRGEERALYPAAVAAGLAFAASGFVVTTLVCVLLAAVLVVDHARVARAGRAATVDRAEAAARRLDDWVTPAARSFLLFVGVWVVFYAPRSAPGEGFDLADPVGWLRALEATLVVPVQRFVGVRVDNRLRTGAGHPLLDFLMGYADLLATLALPTLGLAVGAFFYDRYRPGTRPLVAFCSFWAGLSLFFFPVTAEQLAPWVVVHTLVPLSVPAAVGAAALLRFGRRAAGDRDAGRTLVATLLVVGVLLHVGSVAAWGTYGPSDRDNHLAQYGQPADDLDPLVANASAAIEGNDAVDVVYVGEAYYTSPNDPRQPPVGTAWGNRLPLPWYFERMGAETASVRAPGELSSSPPVVVAEPQYADDLREPLSEYRVDRYRLGLWNREVVVFTRR
ncbi:flippase activity-associated protein Agl23 [Halobium salinum]|uniref:Flippase activity-associated protein Agl23 n=1 Tax=Halobium salinum TaxID=1364940 RepID=A0ABD5PHJ6_9EURY|nr:flippase activity-associated protein Agl23 [Halobium salinum]